MPNDSIARPPRIERRRLPRSWWSTPAFHLRFAFRYADPEKLEVWGALFAVTWGAWIVLAPVLAMWGAATAAWLLTHWAQWAPAWVPRAAVPTWRPTWHPWSMFDTNPAYATLARLVRLTGLPRVLHVDDEVVCGCVVIGFGVGQLWAIASNRTTVRIRGAQLLFGFWVFVLVSYMLADWRPTSTPATAFYAWVWYLVHRALARPLPDVSGERRRVGRPPRASDRTRGRVADPWHADGLEEHERDPGLEGDATEGCRA